jgi:hypothetical protein
VSKEERSGVPAGESSATPLGLGDKFRKPAEELAAESKESGRIDTGPQGPSQRPSGTSTAEFGTGVDPEETATDAPNMTSGDQGG